jgi:predicted transcriptional regulator
MFERSPPEKPCAAECENERLERCDPLVSRHTAATLSGNAAAQKTTPIYIIIAKQTRSVYVTSKARDRGEFEMSEQLERSKIAELTTEIVAAYVSYHQIRPTDVPTIINAVGIELAALGKDTDAGASKKIEPVISVRRSVRPDHLVCLICGKKQKLLKRHLTVEHELTPDEYRQKFGLKTDYPMVAPDYAQQRRELALSIGLGKPKKAVRRRRKPATR